MGRKRPGRSVKNNINNNNIESNELVQAPHSFVIHKGLPGGNTFELTKDFRKVMEPFTASSLKERKKNTVKDFVSLAGLFHVSNLVIFSRAEMGMYLKIIRLPRGPTLTFKIQNFTLSRDVISSLRKQRVVDEAFKHSPLIVLNSFSGEGMQLKMMASMFQNMFPTINLTTVDLNTVKRCVLLNYNPTTKLVDFRHYNIKIVPVGISKGVKKVVQGKVPNLSRCNDITEFFTKSGMLSESEAEDDPLNHVTLAQKIVSRGNMEMGKSSIRLSELGPRLSLQLIKVEDGVLDGEVLYHDLIHRSEEEKEQIRRQREQKRKLKENRKRIQDTNKKAKDQAKEEHKEKSLKGMQKGGLETNLLMKKASREARQDAPVEDDDDAEYYKQEVGEEPDRDTFSTRTGVKRKFDAPHYKSKKPKFGDAENSDNNKIFNKRLPFDKKSPFNKASKRNNGETKFDNKKKFNDSSKRNGETKFDNKKKFNKSSKRNDGETKFDNKKKFNKSKFRGKDKTNSQNRDQRPIGGKSMKRKSSMKRKEKSRR